MGKFNRPKKPSTEPPGLADFAAGAEARVLHPVATPVPAQMPKSVAASASVGPPVSAPVVRKPQASLDPNAKPTKGINLRLNDYELEMLHRVAALEDRSVQKVIKRILVPALEAAHGSREQQ